ncbi:hypothetical protein fugu_018619 [Takifugu bimaculatus]|uniref:Endothelin-like toxin domain-containing protein n=1 Tax=Takifugu bimaculatus TaxID=433685 RepID=A0A4Z2BN57_9TELE|nr:hypothetical protein fugu_018619 [Takifugu bimaculatus]
MRMAPFTCTLLTLFFTSFALQEGCGLPLSDQAALPAPEERPRHIRTKRCSCSNWEDKECIYFCHLDIIWVNTPSKVLPFGLGGPPSRRRRSAERCRCLDPADCLLLWFLQPKIRTSKICPQNCRNLEQEPAGNLQDCGQIQHVCRQQEASPEQNHQIEAQVDLRRDSAVRGPNFLHRTLRGRAWRLFPTLFTRKTEELKRAWNRELVPDSSRKDQLPRTLQLSRRRRKIVRLCIQGTFSSEMFPNVGLFSSASELERPVSKRFLAVSLAVLTMLTTPHCAMKVRGSSKQHECLCESSWALA